MSYQYVFCPTCNTSRIAQEHRCSVCDQPLHSTSAKFSSREALVESVYSRELAGMLRPAQLTATQVRSRAVQPLARNCRTKRFRF